MRCITLLLVVPACLVLLTATARAENPLNGSAPRPFYIVAHNPNTMDDVDAALAAGANALEPDITHYSCGSLDPLDNLVDCDSDNPFLGCGCGSTKLVDWLDGVHQRALKHPELAFIAFDCKSPAAAADNGLAILQAIRQHLNTGGVDIPFAISIGTTSDGAIFDQIIGPGAQVQLGDREGVQVDGDNSASAVVSFFRTTKKFNGNIGYGDGTSVGDVIGLYSFVDEAVYLRASNEKLQMVPYVFTINSVSSMNGFIDAGVDGIITDDVAQLKSVVQGRSDVVPATRAYNPFRFPNEAYALRIRTGSDGTDANITFTLQGTLGTSTITVDTSHVGRMESGDTNYVTIPSQDLGALQSITVSNDGTGNGPDWELLDIAVSSARYMGAHSCARDPTAVFNQVVPAHGSRTAFFVTDQYAWLASPLAPDGTAARPWTLFADAYCAVPPGGIIHVASGHCNEKLTLSKPCRVQFWNAHGAPPARIGGP